MQHLPSKETQGNLQVKSHKVSSFSSKVTFIKFILKKKKKTRFKTLEVDKNKADIEEIYPFSSSFFYNLFIPVQGSEWLELITEAEGMRQAPYLDTPLFHHWTTHTPTRPQIAAA